jgi:hypothetical protein
MPSTSPFIKLELELGCLVASIPDPCAKAKLIQELGQDLSGELCDVLLSGGRADKLLYLLRLSANVRHSQIAQKAIEEASYTLFLWIMGLEPWRKGDVFHEIFPLFYTGNIKVFRDVQDSWKSLIGKLESWKIVDDQIQLQVNGVSLTLPLPDWKNDRGLIMFDKKEIHETLGSVLWERRVHELFKTSTEDENFLRATVPI